MVRIAEIISHESKYDLIDALQDQELANEIYTTYNLVMKLTANMSIMPYELPSNVAASLRYDVSDKFKKGQGIFKAKSTAKIMLDELKWFFEIE